MRFFGIVLGVLLLFIVIVLIRTFMGPTLWDRLLGFNTISSKIVMCIVILALMTKQTYFLDVALAYAILGFIGTIWIAKYIQKEDEHD